MHHVQQLPAHMAGRPAPVPAALQGQLHDIRGLSSTIGLAAERLLVSPDAEARRQARRLARCLDRLDAICDAELPYDSAAAGETIERIVADVEALAASFARPDCTILSRVGGDLCAGDIARPLFRILFNLTVNAVHAVNGAGGGRVRLIVSKVEDVVLFEVSDEGPGIGNAPHAHGTNAARRHGIGLSIAERLADQIGACLVLGPSGPAGTVFYLLLDRAVLEAGADRAGPQHEPDGPTPRTPRSSPLSA